ncbi:MAG: SDR family NAD(P)-dependent oxidoreductase, partial [Mycobacterium sp.]
MSALSAAEKVAVVTGGSSGIGKAIAERLSKDGYRVAVFDLNPGEAPHSYVVDVTDKAQIETALASIHEELGPVTILVNAAGLDGFKPFLKISFDEWQKVVNVNLHGVFHTIQSILPDMIAAGWGRIVNISSSSTHSGTPFMTHYVSAKSAVNGLTKSLALEYGPKGITVNAVPPGFIDTPMLRAAA